MEMLSPGVYVHEEDRSQIVASSSSSVGVFCGDFVKGPIGAYKLINTVEELEGYYGKPTPNNQNDWFQVQNYLTYASQIYVARAGNVNGKETELSTVKIKQIGKTVEPVPGVKASSVIATAVEEGEAGNNLVVSVTKGTPEIVSAGKAASNALATAKADGTAGNSITIKVEKSGVRVLKEGVKATSAVATAKAVGTSGNNLSVSVTESESVLNERTVKTFTVVTKENNIEVDRQENVQNASSLVDNDRVEFTVSDLSAGEFQLTGGKDPETADLFTVYTIKNSTVSDKQENIQNSTDLNENELVEFKIFDLSAGEFPLTGGKDPVQNETFDVTTLDKTKPFDFVKQSSVKSYSELKNNAYVVFDKDFVLQTGDFELSGGVDGFAGGLDLTKIYVSNMKDLVLGTILRFEHDGDLYKIVSLDNAKFEVTLDRPLPTDPDYQPALDTYPLSVEIVLNGSAEAVSSEFVQDTTYLDENEVQNSFKVPNVVSAEDLFANTQREIITNDTVFDDSYDSISFTSPKSKIKFISRNPGAWSKNIKICIARPESFELNDTSENHIPRYAFPGILVDDFFEYAPKDGQVGVLIYDEDTDQVVETYTASFDKDAKDSNNKSMYIETLINKNSDYVFCKVNEANNSEIADYTLRYSVNAFGEAEYVGTTLALKNGSDSSIQKDDLIDAYALFENKEEIEVDNIIGNELDGGKTAINLVTTRKDCIAFIGAYYDDVVNKKSQKCVENLVKWRKTGDLNVNSMFSVAIGNYAQIYNKYTDRNIWVNMAGMCAGLRSQTSKNYDAWWASAGLERGQLQNIIKLAFNPTQAQRDTLYKNSINPVATFPSLGTVLWGQKTLLGTASAWDRVNVRALFNTLERALAKMAKSTVMEFNDTYTRSHICSVIRPYLAQVQAGRGIQGFLVVCDESNNTPQIIANNQLVVDIYIQPTYVAEMIRLNFINSGTNSFSTESTS